MCTCHSGPLYAGLTTCPACGHWSLDRGRTWEGCERRACGYERSLKDDAPAVGAPTTCRASNQKDRPS